MDGAGVAPKIPLDGAGPGVLKVNAPVDGAAVLPNDGADGVAGDMEKPVAAAGVLVVAPKLKPDIPKLLLPLKFGLAEASTPNKEEEEDLEDNPLELVMLLKLPLLLSLEAPVIAPRRAAGICFDPIQRQ